MARKIVGITCSGAAATETRGARQTLNRVYIESVERAGAAVLLLPATRDADALAAYLRVLDGLLLSGGVDVDPACYGTARHEKLGDVDAERDATELPLIRMALAQNMPIFAICRGIQTLNVALGGTLYQDLPSECPSDIQHGQTQARSERTHSIEVQPDTRLAEIVGAGEMRVNSFHHQALRDVAAPLVVTARAPDGVIEAAESPAHRYVVAVQFHPEETAATDPRSHRLFEAFARAL